jgi:hypothetical protein
LEQGRLKWLWKRLGGMKLRLERRLKCGLERGLEWLRRRWQWRLVLEESLRWLQSLRLEGLGRLGGVYEVIKRIEEEIIIYRMRVSTTSTQAEFCSGIYKCTWWRAGARTNVGRQSRGRIG